MTVEGNTLELLCDGRIIFSSRAHWLHPLLELETFLSTWNGDRNSLELHDTKSGRAGAALVILLGIRNVEIGLASRYALDLYGEYGVRVRAGQTIERIDCMTEKLITPDMSPAEIRRLVLSRISD